MTLLNPGALWLLSLSAVVIVVYFLRRRARPVTVSALFLWQGVERRPRSALRLRWTRLLGLLLQLLALSALVVGLAQPALTFKAGGARSLILVVDASASLRATLSPQGPERFREAVEAARALLQAHPAAEVALVAASARPRVLVPPTRDRADVERALGAFAPTYEGDARPEALLSLVRSLAPDTAGQGREVALITDHPPAFDAAALGWTVVLVTPEGRGESKSPRNVAITRFAVRPQPAPEGGGYGLLLELWNSEPHPMSARLELYADDRPLEARAVELPPGATPLPLALTLTSNALSATRFRAELVLPEGVWDAWPEDNVRYAVPPLQRPWRGLWLGAPSPYVERFLRRAGLAEVRPLEPGLEPENEPGNEGNVDWVLVHKLPSPDVEPVGPGRYLLLGSGLPPWVELGDPIELEGRPLPLRVRGDHPLLDGLDFASWRLLRAPGARVDPRGVVLLEAGGVPLLYLYEAPGLKIAYLGVDLERSNLWLTVDFPILLYRLLEWLAPRPTASAQLLVGEELPLSFFEIDPSNPAPPRLARPEGRTCRLSEPGCGRIDRPGFYAVIEGEGRGARAHVYVYAANPPPEESLQAAFTPPSQGPTRGQTGFPPTPPAGGASSERNALELEGRRPLWREALLVGLLALIAELVYVERGLLLPIGRRRARLHVQRKRRKKG